jgi:hypothetical protein
MMSLFDYFMTASVAVRLGSWCWSHSLLITATMPIVPFQHIGVPVGLMNANDVSQGSTPDMSQQRQQADNGGPYPPRVWQLGGAPKVGVDVPITAVFLVLFIIGAAAHMTIFQINMRKGHKFLMSALLFGMCFNCSYQSMSLIEI